MAKLSEVEAVLKFLVNAVISSVDNKEEEAQDVEVLPVGGYLWKFPSEGSNRLENCNLLPPPVPQTLDYPRKCSHCGVCWVSDREFELDHLRQCSAVDHVEDIRLKAMNLGVARRVWCEVDESLSRLQWRYDRDLDSDSTTDFIEFVDIAEIIVLDEPVNSFQIATHTHRTIVFQWRPGSDTASDLGPYRMELDARQWQEYLDELSRYARNSPMEAQAFEERSSSVDDVFKEITCLLGESSAQDTRVVLVSKLHALLEKSRFKSHPSSLCDDDGNSLVHLAIRLNLGHRTSAIVSALVSLGVDCNLQNQDGESPLLLVAASGDVDSGKVLLTAPFIQVNLECALGVTALHAAANAGDVKMMRLLCDAGAQPEKKDDNGWTALHYAAACSSGLEVINFLCEMLDDDFIDAQCTEGNTALHVAAGCGCLENVRALLETAASPHISNLNGESAYHLALRNHRIQCAVAINDYQSIPSTGYTLPLPHLAKESKPTTIKGGEWIESFTEDGYPFYYNTNTGESSWYKPGEYQLMDAFTHLQQDERNSGIYGEGMSDNDTGHSFCLAADHESGSILRDTTGEQLPLCLIPMVSPLTSLDNPTAAEKYEAARRRARKQRRRRQSKLHLVHHHEAAVLNGTRQTSKPYQKY
ncbi:putative WW domain-containing protein [Phytophthora infestans]|uniref:Putative WW domain-containing protein n=1 Tax=Phytophthora infestans TaxID=4787 RepID=A0A833S3Q0_PHYIN|nr:putative WW domain-containing protein [Phytophthora infestans]